MNSCPHCKKAIEVNWSYCHHCDKPLIVNLLKEAISPIENLEIYDEENNNSTAFHEMLYDPNQTKEEEFRQRIQDIDYTIDQKIIFGESIGSLLLEKASLYYHKNDLATSLKILESALNSFMDENDLVNIAISHNEIGLIHEENGFYDDAIYHFEQATNILEDAEDYNKLIQTYNNLANIYYILKDIEHSYEYYDKALKLSEQENLVSEEIKTSSNLVEILFYLKDYERIERILKRNLEYFRQRDDIYGVIVSISKMGKLYYNLGSTHYKQADQILREALDLIKKVRTQDVIYKAKLRWECFLYLGKVNLAWNKEDLAESFFMRSLESLRNFENESIKECSILESIAFLYEVKAEYQKAVEFYSLCYEIFQKFGNDFEVASLKYKVAQIYSEYIKEETVAIKFFEEALEIFKDLKYSKETAEIFHRLGDIYLKRGIIELALDYFEKAKLYYLEFQDETNLNVVLSKIKTLIKKDTNIT